MRQVFAWSARFAFSALVFASGAARAHVDLKFPLARHATNYEKDAPCGKAGNDPRGAQTSTFEPGATITVRWEEYIDHPGHFRLWFDDDGQDAFTYPASPTSIVTGNPLVLDNIADKSEPDPGKTKIEYEVQFTLPDIECSNCTLQLVQVMTDKCKASQYPAQNGVSGCTGGNNAGNWGNDDLYFDCADLVLQQGAGNTTDPGDADAGTSDAGTATVVPIGTMGDDAHMHGHEEASKSESGCALHASSSNSAPFAGLLALVAWLCSSTRRRQRLPKQE